MTIVYTHMILFLGLYILLTEAALNTHLYRGRKLQYIRHSSYVQFECEYSLVLSQHLDKS